MKKYFVVYLAPVEEIQKLMASMTPETSKEVMAAWNKWYDDHRGSVVELGAPLGKTKRVSETGVSDVKNDLTGYTIVQADSHDEAAKLFLGHPHFEIGGAVIDLMEMVEMPT